MERIMAKAARSSVLMSTPASVAEEPTRVQSAKDIFMTVMIFSLTGLLLSLGALALGWPLVWD
jgi:hypothetical protein